MDYISTRHSSLSLRFDEAILQGLSNEGGLLIPRSKPSIDVNEWVELSDFLTFTETLLGLYLKDSMLESHLSDICRDAFSFDIPLDKIEGATFLLSLYHGPTLSFKDVGARFLSACLSKLKKPITIMVATSGDTGSAVASAFSGLPQVQVVILYPKGKISKRQEAQIICWENNIKPVSVDGNFDDCQALLKAALQDDGLNARTQLSTANSINIGRLIPQMTYFAYWSTRFYHTHAIKPSIIIPSGNLGHMTACYWAKQMGFPIGDLVIATNANQTLTRYARTGDFHPTQTEHTLANAMDVSAPSNFERLHHDLKTQQAFNEAFTVLSVSDDEIKSTIKSYYSRYKRMICPHTATGCFARDQLNNAKIYFVAETAHPAKFDSVIEPILGVAPPIPKRLSAMLNKMKPAECISPSLNELIDII